MITYKSGPFIQFVAPIEQIFFEFMLEHTDADPISMRLRFESQRFKNTGAQVVLAYDDRKLVGFYIWRALKNSEYLKANSDLADAIYKAGFSIDELYNPIMLIVHKDYRRQGISSAMANHAATVAKRMGFSARLFYLIESETVKQQRDANHSGKMIDLDYKDKVSGTVHILPLDV